jgi:hypothetical protein
LAFGSAFGAGQRPSNTAVVSDGSVVAARPQPAALEDAFTASAESLSWSKKPRHSAGTLDGSAAQRSCISSM